MTRTCIACRHFKPDDKENRELGGFCLRYAPRHPGFGSNWGWPAVGSANWCGEWALPNDEWPAHQTPEVPRP